VAVRTHLLFWGHLPRSGRGLLRDGNRTPAGSRRCGRCRPGTSGPAAGTSGPAAGRSADTSASATGPARAA